MENKKISLENEYKRKENLWSKSGFRNETLKKNAKDAEDRYTDLIRKPIHDHMFKLGFWRSTPIEWNNKTTKILINTHTLSEKTFADDIIDHNYKDKKPLNVDISTVGLNLRYYLEEVGFLIYSDINVTSELNRIVFKHKSFDDKWVVEITRPETHTENIYILAKLNNKYERSFKKKFKDIMEIVRR